MPLSVLLALALDAAAVFAEIERQAARPLWPGFEPGKIPYALFDGERTYLFGHPAPPPEFARRAGRVLVMDGRHPEVTSNSSAEIGGVVTATAVFTGATPPSARAAAAVLIHEAFHVHQSTAYPRWVANEMDLFTYPVDDVEAAALAILEARLLYAAAGAREMVRCKASAISALRRDRFAGLSEAARNYERGLELKEGLAAYVQGRALGRRAARREGFPLSSVRDRAYATGEAMALILDRISPDWKERVGSEADVSLDAILADAIATQSARCEPSEQERAQARTQANREAQTLRSQRRRERQAFLGARGWRLEVVADESMLWPQGFDPLNLRSLGGGEALHTRWLKAGNDRGTIEVLGGRALTEGVGPHPILQGIRMVVVTGLREPTIQENEGSVEVKADGVTARFSRARLERQPGVIRVRLHP